MVLQQSVEVFLYLVFDAQNNNKKTRAFFKKSRTSEGEDTKQKKEEEKNAKRRTCVGSFSRFPDFCGTFFSSSLSSSVAFVLVVFSLFSNTPASPISHPIVFLARAVLFLGFKREREREREKE
jgi:hypothetical protein